MADSELRFIASLLFANVNDQQEIFLKQIPPTLFLQREKEYNWVTEFRRKYGKYPQAKTFEAHFKEQLKRPKDPPKALLQVVLDRSFYEQIKKNVQTVKGMIDIGSPMENVVRKYREDANAIKTFTTSTVEVHRQHSSTVETYYRERVRLNYEPNAIIIDSPWPTLNKLCGLFFPKDTFIIGARMSLGKTWKLMYWASYLAKKGIRVLICSFEMGTMMLELRDEAIWCELPFNGLKDGTLTPKQLAKWRKLKRKGRPYELYFVDPDEGAVGNQFGVVEEAIDRIRPQVLMLDSYYLANHPNFRPHMADTQRMGILSGALKPLAKRTNAMVIASVQIGRPGEDKKGKTRPSLVSVYGSDRWAQDSDYFEDISGTRGSDRRLNTVLKGRNSAVGEYRTYFSIDPPDFSEKSVLGLPDDEESSTAEFEALI